MSKIVVLLVGGSGSGKSTLESNLKLTAPDQFEKIVSTTTRAPRAGEVDGVDYHFVSKEVFDTLDLMERVEFNGNFYGVEAKEFETEKDILLVVEPNGAKQIIDKLQGKTPYLLIYMGGASRANMELRGDSPEDIEKRLAGDDIEKRFQESGLVANKQIKKLTTNLHLDVYEYISFFKKNLM